MLVGSWPVYTIVLAILDAYTYSNSVLYLIIRRIFPLIQTNSRHVSR